MQGIRKNVYDRFLQEINVFLSPVERLRLRSVRSVMHFIDLLPLYGNDESQAYQALQNGVRAQVPPPAPVAPPAVAVAPPAVAVARPGSAAAAAAPPADEEVDRVSLSP